MRAPCKYAHDVTYLRWVDDALVDVTVDECWGEKEPSVCDARRKEYCDRYKPFDENKHNPEEYDRDDKCINYDYHMDDRFFRIEEVDVIE